MTMKEKRYIIVFAKEPRPGQVKTRLRDCLSERNTLALYKAFIRDTVALVNKSKNTNKVMAYHAQGAPVYLRRAAPGYALYKQEGASLGQRLFRAFVFARKQGADKTVIIGSDTPDLPVACIETAFRKLSRHDVVFGPSEDGGYYLVALKKPIRIIFEGIKWSTPAVLKESLRKAAGADKKVYLLKPWRDIDRREDLEAISAAVETNTSAAAHTRTFLYGKCFKSACRDNTV